MSRCIPGLAARVELIGTAAWWYAGRRGSCFCCGMEDRVPRPEKLLTKARRLMRARHLSPRTEQAYLSWVRRYARYHGLRHPAQLGGDEVVGYLTHLANERRVSRATQAQAMSALLFLYREVLGIPIDNVRSVVRARVPGRLPVVLSRTEVRRILAELSGGSWLVSLLLYGAGLRLNEGLSLRVKGRGPGSARSDRASRKGFEGSDYDVTGGGKRAFAGAIGAGEDVARARLGDRRR